MPKTALELTELPTKQLSLYFITTADFLIN